MANTTQCHKYSEYDSFPIQTTNFSEKMSLIHCPFSLERISKPVAVQGKRAKTPGK